MNLKKALTKDLINLKLQGSSKDEVITELVDMLAAAGRLSDRDATLKAVFEREEKMSTGMQHGIAIPHGKTNTVEGLVAAVGIKKSGLDFGSLDGAPSKIFIMTISPVNRTGPHIQFLAEISRLLNEESVRKKIIEADSEEAILDFITRYKAKASA